MHPANQGQFRALKVLYGRLENNPATSRYEAILGPVRRSMGVSGCRSRVAAMVLVSVAGTESISSKFDSDSALPAGLGGLRATSSPSSSPDLTSTRSVVSSPTWTSRRSSVSSFATKTTFLPWSDFGAWQGTANTLFRGRSAMSTRVVIPGLSPGETLSSLMILMK